MNTIEIKTITISNGYKNEYLLIDGKPLHEYLIMWYQQNGWGEILQPIAPVDELALTLTAELFIMKQSPSNIRHSHSLILSRIL